MLYRFKCKAAADVVMLEKNGKQLLEILGKDPQAPGILLLDQMPNAIKALQDAVVDEEREFEQRKQEALANGEDPPNPDRISLRMRVAPFVEMIHHCQREEADIVWGV